MSQHVFGTGEEAIDDKHQIEMQETVPKGEDSLPVIHASQAYGLTRGQVFRKYWKVNSSSWDNVIRVNLLTRRSLSCSA
jgi:hypothetical protein